MVPAAMPSTTASRCPHERSGAYTIILGDSRAACQSAGEPSPWIACIGESSNFLPHIPGSHGGIVVRPILYLHSAGFGLRI
jgi:hypothetical protein